MLYLISQAVFQLILRTNQILELLGIYMNSTKHATREITLIRLYSNIPLTSAHITTTTFKEHKLKTYFIHKAFKFQIF